jgi:hypothetical protein
LLANNGSSTYLCASQNTTIPANSTTMSLLQAVKTFGVNVSPSPSPSSSPMPTRTPEPTETPKPTSSASPEPTVTPRSSSTPINSPSATVAPSQTPQPSNSPTATSTESPTTSPTETASPTAAASPSETSSPTATQNPNAFVTQSCEACGMPVTPADQVRYVVTDGKGNVHYVECFMCALNLVNDYETLQIKTCCDWYGTNSPITIDTSQYGKVSTVTPDTAIFLNGGSCVINRAAYNQTAADALLANGFSQNTLPDKQYALPSGTTVTTVKDYIAKVAKVSGTQQTQNNNTNTTVLVAVGAVAGIVVVVGAVVAFKKLKLK